MEGVVFQTSLIAAFLAGMVALFAPCCISFLLPAYLGNVFKEKEKVVLMTLIFGFGIFLVMLPAVLGVAILSKFLFVYHDSLYIAGGVVMLLVAALTFSGIKLPMVKIPGRSLHKTDPLSILILGIFSGITSACCAPVLIGILALTFLSPSFFGALGIGAVYVLGMVTPLFVISVLLSGRANRFLFLKKPLFHFSLLGKERLVSVSGAIAGSIFALTGFFILYLSLTGRLGMKSMGGFTAFVMQTGDVVNHFFGNNIFLNILFIAVILFVLYKIIRKEVG